MLQFTVLAAALAIAVVTDVRTRRIPNVLTASMAIAGFVIAAAGLGVTPAQAGLGLLVGLAVMMPGHVIGATGAGDVCTGAGAAGSSATGIGSGSRAGAGGKRFLTLCAKTPFARPSFQTVSVRKIRPLSAISLSCRPE